MVQGGNQGSGNNGQREDNNRLQRQQQTVGAMMQTSPQITNNSQSNSNNTLAQGRPHQTQMGSRASASMSGPIQLNPPGASNQIVNQRLQGAPHDQQIGVAMGLGIQPGSIGASSLPPQNYGQFPPPAPGNPQFLGGPGRALMGAHAQFSSNHHLFGPHTGQHQAQPQPHLQPQHQMMSAPSQQPQQQQQQMSVVGSFGQNQMLLHHLHPQPTLGQQLQQQPVGFGGALQPSGLFVQSPKNMNTNGSSSYVDMYSGQNRNQPPFVGQNLSMSPNQNTSTASQKPSSISQIIGGEQALFNPTNKQSPNLDQTTQQQMINQFANQLQQQQSSLQMNTQQKHASQGLIGGGMHGNPLLSQTSVHNNYSASDSAQMMKPGGTRPSPSSQYFGILPPNQHQMQVPSQSAPNLYPNFPNQLSQSQMVYPSQQAPHPSDLSSLRQPPPPPPAQQQQQQLPLSQQSSSVPSNFISNKPNTPGANNPLAASSAAAIIPSTSPVYGGMQPPPPVGGQGLTSNSPMGAMGSAATGARRMSPRGQAGADTEHEQNVQYQLPQLPLKKSLDFSDEKNQQLFIYRQKYNMQKNDFFNLEKRKQEIDKEARIKDKEIARLQTINEKLKQQESSQSTQFRENFSLESLVKIQNEQIQWIEKQQEQSNKKMEKALQLYNIAKSIQQELNQQIKTTISKDLNENSQNKKANSAADTSQQPQDEASDSAPLHPQSQSKESNQILHKEIKSVSDSLDKLNNELKYFLGKKFEVDQFRQLTVEDVKEQKMTETSESNNVIAMEKMYENIEVQNEINKLLRVKDNVLTPQKLKNILQKSIPQIEQINQNNNQRQIFDKLHNEVLLFKQDLNEMQVELKKFKEKLLGQLYKIINEDRSPDQVLQLVMYGSNYTNLCMHWSNIDLLIKHQSPPPANQNGVNSSLMNSQLQHSLSQILVVLEKEMDKSQWLSNLRLQQRANKLTLTMTCSLKQFMTQNEIEYPQNLKYEALYDRSIDINIIEFATTNAENSEWIELTNEYLKECWIIEPLIYILKQIMKVNQMNNILDEHHNWGFFSQDLFLIVVAYLQKDESNYQKYCHFPEQVNLGEILIQMLKEFAKIDKKDLIKIQCKAPGQKNQMVPTIQIVEGIEINYLNSIEIYHPKQQFLVRKYQGPVVYKFKEILAKGHQQAYQGCFCSHHFSEVSLLLYKQSLEDLIQINNKIQEQLQAIQKQESALRNKTSAKTNLPVVPSSTNTEISAGTEREGAGSGEKFNLISSANTTDLNDFQEIKKLMDLYVQNHLIRRPQAHQGDGCYSDEENQEETQKLSQIQKKDDKGTSKEVQSEPRSQTPQKNTSQSKKSATRFSTIRYMDQSGEVRFHPVHKLYKPESILHTHCDSPLVKVIYSYLQQQLFENLTFGPYQSQY